MPPFCCVQFTKAGTVVCTCSLQFDLLKSYQIRISKWLHLNTATVHFRTMMNCGEIAEVLGSDGRWAKATILSIVDGSYRVRFEKWSKKWDEEIGAAKVRPITQLSESAQKPRRIVGKYPNPEGLFKDRQVQVENGDVVTVLINDPFLKHVQASDGKLYHYDTLRARVTRPQQNEDIFLDMDDLNDFEKGNDEIENDEESNNVDERNFGNEETERDNYDKELQNSDGAMESEMFNIRLGNDITSPGSLIKNGDDDYFILASISTSGVNVIPLLMLGTDMYSKNPVHLTLEELSTCHVTNEIKLKTSWLKRVEYIQVTSLAQSSRRAVQNMSVQSKNQRMVTFGRSVRRQIWKVLKKNVSKQSIKIEPICITIDPAFLNLKESNGYSEVYVPPTFHRLDKLLGERWDMRQYGPHFVVTTQMDVKLNIAEGFIYLKLKTAWCADVWDSNYRETITNRLQFAQSC